MIALIIVLLIGSLLQAQKVSEPSFIIHLEKGISEKSVLEDIDCPLSFERIDPDYNYYVVSGDCVDVDALKNKAGVISASPNLPISTREVIPNDPEYSNQNSFDIIGMPEAWEYTTGGVTRNGEKVVMVVMDELFSFDHPDLNTNWFINEREIPNDGVDNDGNGYIDDYQGFNSKEQNGNLTSGGNWHGTNVAGIFAARGDNNQGIAGINWDAKVLILNPINQDRYVLSNMIYAYKMRKAYNESGGNEGALITAINMSFGRASAGADIDFPEICAWMDSLGRVGVLCVGAAPNQNIDIDQSPDLPCDCKSDYLIGVTNTDNDDNLIYGFALEDIDLGAPEDTYSTDRIDEYDSFNGTSSATAHVTGVIGLLYSIGCTDFLNTVRTNPSEAALYVKDIILASGDDAFSLQGKTSTGKRLSAINAVELMVQQTCFTGNESNQIVHIGQDGFNLRLQLEAKDLKEYVLDLYDAAGRHWRTYDLPAMSSPRISLDLDISNIPAGSYFGVLRSDKIEDSQPFVIAK
jgi:subtilisin family serine protease